MKLLRVVFDAVLYIFFFILVMYAAGRFGLSKVLFAIYFGVTWGIVAGILDKYLG